MLPAALQAEEKAQEKNSFCCFSLLTASLGGTCEPLEEIPAVTLTHWLFIKAVYCVGVIQPVCVLTVT